MTSPVVRLIWKFGELQYGVRASLGGVVSRAQRDEVWADPVALDSTYIRLDQRSLARSVAFRGAGYSRILNPSDSNALFTPERMRSYSDCFSKRIARLSSEDRD